jgi:hypothetical protein
MNTYSIIFKRTKDTLENTKITCNANELTDILAFMEIHEENILSIVEIEQ